MEERFLLARLQHKDEKALAQLIDQYAGYVLATVRAAGAGVLAEADLEEAAADTFVKLARPRGGKGRPEIYLGCPQRDSSCVARCGGAAAEEDFCWPDQQAQRRWKSRNSIALVRQALEMLEPATKRFSALLPKAENGALPGKCR
ncbi:MAG: hypothetical protein ACLRWF_05670 [Ruthenibacterium sp.]